MIPPGANRCTETLGMACSIFLGTARVLVDISRVCGSLSLSFALAELPVGTLSQ